MHESKFTVFNVHDVMMFQIYVQRAGYLQVALSFLLNAKDYNLPEFCVEWAEHQRAQVTAYYMN